MLLSAQLPEYWHHKTMLKENVSLEMKNVIEFLGLKFEKNIESCLNQNQVEMFKRPKPKINLRKKFSAIQNKEVKKIKHKLYAKLNIL